MKLVARIALVASVLVACSGTSSTPEGSSSSGSSGSGSSSGTGSGSGGSSGSTSSSGSSTSSGSSSGGSSGSSGSTSSSGGSSGSTSSSGGSSGSTSSSGSGSSGADSGSGFACSSPAQCSGNVCCGTIPVTGGTVPNCTTGPMTVACTPGDQCKTSLGTTCSGTQTVRLCAQNADCTESGANKCCTFTQDGGSLSFCANAIVAGVGGGKCM